MPRKKYIEVREKLNEDVDIESMDFNLLRKYLDEIEAKYRTHRKFSVKFAYHGYDGAYDMEIYATRDETEEERKKRLHKSAKAREARAKQIEQAKIKEQELYKKLKKKWGPIIG